eukprot:221669_1
MLPKPIAPQTKFEDKTIEIKNDELPKIKVQVIIRKKDSVAMETFELRDNDTIYNLKQIIAQQEKIPTKDQKIIYNNKELDNEKTIQFYIKKQPQVYTKQQEQQAIIFHLSNNTNKVTGQNENKLEAMLKKHDLYNDLYDILVKNELEFDVLKYDIDEKDLHNNVFNELGINSDDNKIAFKKLLIMIKNQINIILIGDENIGKKSLIKRYVRNEYNDDDEKYEEKQEYSIKQQGLSDLETIMQINIKIISDINELNNNKLIDVIMVCYDINNEETFI